jgi:hypothetical protein
MLRLKKLLTVPLLVLLLSTVPTAYAQSAPTKVKVGDVEYNVTPMARGRMLRVDDLDGHMIGMANVNGPNVSVLAPQQEPGFSVVKGAATEYLHNVNGAATATGNAPPSPAATPAAGDDPRTAQREALLAKLANAPALTGNPLGPAKPTVEFPAEGGAIVHGTKYGDITFPADATQGRTVKPTVSGTPQIFVAEYEGGDKPSSAAKDIGKGAETLGGALLTTTSGKPVHIVASDDRWKVSVETTHRGQTKKETMSETGGLVGTLNRDAAGSKTDDVMDTVWSAEQLAITAAKAKREAGETVNFDPESTPRGKRAFEAIKKYEHAN